MSDGVLWPSDEFTGMPSSWACANEFVSLDGGVQASGRAEEDTDGGSQHGGASRSWACRSTR
jgi:hypothetical protein